MMNKKLEWLWVNINEIYTKESVSGSDWFIDGIQIKGGYNYFDCYFRLLADIECETKPMIGYFRITKEYPLFNIDKGDTPLIYLNPGIPGENIDFYIENLKPIIREWKIKSLV